MTPWWSHAPSWLGGAMSFGFGAADLWHFHGLPMAGDIAFLIAGLAAFGISFLTTPTGGTQTRVSLK